MRNDTWSVLENSSSMYFLSVYLNTCLSVYTHCQIALAHVFKFILSIAKQVYHNPSPGPGCNIRGFYAPQGLIWKDHGRDA